MSPAEIEKRDGPDVIGVIGAVPLPTLSEAILAIAQHIEMEGTEEAAQEGAVLRHAADALAEQQGRIDQAIGFALQCASERCKRIAENHSLHSVMHGGNATISGLGLANMEIGALDCQAAIISGSSAVRKEWNKQNAAKLAQATEPAAAQETGRSSYVSPDLSREKPEPVFAAAPVGDDLELPQQPEFEDNDEPAIVIRALWEYSEALLSLVRKLKRELNAALNLNIVEIAARNPGVAEYCRHWEGRAEKAEQRLAEVEQASKLKDDLIALNFKRAEDAERREEEIK